MLPYRLTFPLGVWRCARGSPGHEGTVVTLCGRGESRGVSIATASRVINGRPMSEIPRAPG